MSLILQQLIVLYVFLSLGWLFGTKKPALREQTGLLSFLLVNLLLPCKVFLSFSTNFTLSYLQNSYQTIFISVGLLLILHLLGKPVGKLLSRDETEKSVLEYSVTISNYAYMGYTLAEGIWGSRMLTDLVLFCIPFAMYTYTVGYMKLTGSKKNLKRLFNPMTVAIALGMIWGLCGIPVPAVLRTAAQSASACVGPLSMLLTGFVLSTFSFSSLWGSPRDYVMVVLRLVVLPAFVWGLFWLCGLKSFSTPALLMASMPTGLNTIIFTKNAGRSPALGARLAFLSGILSIVTLPLWLSILQ